MSSYAGFCPVQVYLQIVFYVPSMRPLARFDVVMGRVRMDSSYSLTEHVRPEDGGRPTLY